MAVFLLSEILGSWNVPVWLEVLELCAEMRIIGPSVRLELHTRQDVTFVLRRSRRPGLVVGCGSETLTSKNNLQTQTVHERLDVGSVSNEMT